VPKRENENIAIKVGDHEGRDYSDLYADLRPFGLKRPWDSTLETLEVRRVAVIDDGKRGQRLIDRLAGANTCTIDCPHVLHLAPCHPPGITSLRLKEHWSPTFQHDYERDGQRANR
jgi:hypothetical protein